MNLTALGKQISEFEQFDVFPAPDSCDRVIMRCDEITALCPVTSQPDFYEVVIDYEPNTLCLESKTLKLYLASFRDKGIFAEALASTIRNDVSAALRPKHIFVSVIQKARGGISIEAQSNDL